MIKKIFHRILAQAQVEQMKTENNSPWMKRVWEDHVARYELAVLNLKQGKILDIACGEGYGAALLAGKAKTVMGVDSDTKVIAAAKKKYYPRHANLTFVCDDALSFLQNNKNQWDGVVSFETIEHLKDYKKFLQLISENLKSDGTLIMSTPNKLFSDLLAGNTFNPFHAKEFYAQELSQLITETFGSRPRIYWQRPVKKSRLFWSLIYNFLLKSKSQIIPLDSQHEGIAMIFVVKKV